ncbi:Uu.00g112350.m01.CDS01 [Anthostomella pinea]|uniref:Uu.00g112350.m01.CDS01 n=1 Tax=Anthostomella pinea TaxID=933095 RepID=A0AAI8YGG4_9PEZI|nr:Uu.00g112350.m01.CDS01 [Anthostomella pinea]
MAAAVQGPPFFSDLSHGQDARLPELREIDYFNEVFQLSANGTEAYLNTLIAKAANLGISVSRPSTAVSAADKRNMSGGDSNITLDTNHARTVSTGSDDSTSTALTSPSSNDGHDFTGKILTRRRSRGLTFTQYENYLAQVDPNLNQPKFLSHPAAGSESAASVFSVSTRKSYMSLKKGLSKMSPKRRTLPCPEALLISCSACREDLQPDETFERLPCGHIYCPSCLRIMINQATTEESKMPPRCCTQPIPGSIIKTVLAREEQTRFLKAVLQFSTPWEARVFCSKPTCGEFIPPRAKIDPKHPFQAMCRKCRTKVCVMCKRDAHPIGQDCPGDWELEAVLKMGEKSGWQEEARVAALEAEEAVRNEAAAKEAANRDRAEERTRNSQEFQVLRMEQVKERERFQMFEHKSKWLLWTRHAQQKLALVERHSGAMEKMKERHAKTSANLEDRQVAAEMELRSTLEQSERNVRIRLKHMEAYCEGLGRRPSSEMPSRVVTERDLRELGQQYNVEKNMKQLHQAKVNVMRDRQAKALEQLLERQEMEMARITEKHLKEIEHLESDFADEEEILANTFYQRRYAIGKRWELEMEIMRKELENEKGLRYSVLPPLEWPREKEATEDGLSAVDE